MKEMYKDNAGNWHYGNKGEELPGISYSANSIIDKVDAIPIEWIKNWFNPKYANTVYYSLLRDMIKDWEKENERV